jgi:hypothetical protein
MMRQERRHGVKNQTKEMVLMMSKNMKRALSSTEFRRWLFMNLKKKQQQGEE